MIPQSEEVADTGAGVADPAVDPSPHRTFTSAGMLVQPAVLQLSLQQRARARACMQSRSCLPGYRRFLFVCDKPLRYPLDSYKHCGLNR